MQINAVTPYGAIPGGEFTVRGSGLLNESVSFGASSGQAVCSSDALLIVRVPEGAVPPHGWTCAIGMQIADGLHPVANPCVDSLGNIYSTFSGSAGQKTPVSIFKMEVGAPARPYVTDLMNATGLAVDRQDVLYVSSRNDGVVYQVTASGNTVPYVEGMGVATGIAFDRDENLYVGDRSGTIFKVSRDRKIFVFATLEPSVAAYHLAFGPGGYLYVTGPTTSSFDGVSRISPEGNVERFYRGLGRPQGMAFDVLGNLYVAASFRGRRGVVRIDPEANAELFVSGPAIVGVAFAGRSLILATTNALFKLDAGVMGAPLI